MSSIDVKHRIRQATLTRTKRAVCPRSDLNPDHQVLKLRGTLIGKHATHHVIMGREERSSQPFVAPILSYIS